MKKKLITIVLCVIAIISIMFAEYRYIMINLRPYRCDDGTVYIEFMGQVDEYYADPIEE